MSEIGFLFPGQGAQHLGMGQRLSQECAAAADLYSRAADVLGYDLAAKCTDGPQQELDSTVISQPAIFVTSLAALEWLRADRPELVDGCSMTAGLSLGEYTALVFAGVMEFEDALRVVQKRGAAMQAASDRTPSGMVSLLMMEPEQVEQICAEAAGEGEVLRIANHLGPGNMVVSGHRSACGRAVELAEAAGGRAVELSVAGAFHTSLMEPADQEVAQALADCPLSPPRIPVISNVDAAAHDEPEEIRELLVRQVKSPVLWSDSLLKLIGAGVDQFYEIGPGRVLRGLLRRIDRKLPCESVNDS
ncbi:ACP S-malonyltransferase [Planctomycetaceae bacterium]|nr:ACP S-malonyltransferase [Planctomycetaceae bacterium]